MKNLFLFLFVFAFAIPVFAQTENNDTTENTNKEIRTIFGNRTPSHGGYGAITTNYTDLQGQDGLVMGVRGAWIINHSISLGVAGYGFFNEPVVNSQIDTEGNEYMLAGGYGGLLIEPIVGGLFPVHLAFPVVAGVGGISYARTTYDDTWDETEMNSPEDVDAFLIFEPGVEMEVNVLKNMRICVGAYYRLTTDVSLTRNVFLDNNFQTVELAKPDVLNGFSYGITLKFGKF